MALLTYPQEMEVVAHSRIVVNAIAQGQRVVDPHGYNRCRRICEGDALAELKGDVTPLQRTCHYDLFRPYAVATAKQFGAQYSTTDYEAGTNTRSSGRTDLDASRSS